MHDKFQDETVIFLEISEFDTTGRFTKNMHGKPMVVMMGSTRCPHCTQSAAPVFREFAIDNHEKLGIDKTKVIAAVVYANGSEDEQSVAGLLSSKINKRSIPIFMFFSADGELRDHVVGAISREQLEDFVNRNM